MIGIRIRDGFLDFGKTDFKCPHCGKQYNDDGRYLKRCDKNKSGVTRIKCNCSKSFGVTYDYKSEIVTF
jgi:hypothetical protein